MSTCRVPVPGKLPYTAPCLRCSCLLPCAGGSSMVTQHQRQLVEEDDSHLSARRSSGSEHSESQTGIAQLEGRCQWRCMPSMRRL